MKRVTVLFLGILGLGPVNSYAGKTEAFEFNTGTYTFDPAIIKKQKLEEIVQHLSQASIQSSGYIKCWPGLIKPDLKAYKRCLKDLKKLTVELRDKVKKFVPPKEINSLKQYIINYYQFYFEINSTLLQFIENKDSALFEKEIMNLKESKDCNHLINQWVAFEAKVQVASNEWLSCIEKVFEREYSYPERIWTKYLTSKKVKENYLLIEE